jgi:hypothetical protein
MILYSERGNCPVQKDGVNNGQADPSDPYQGPRLDHAPQSFAHA